MANEKVSQMVGLSAGEMASDDLFLIVDSSARESKKLQLNELVSFVQSSGSFDAYHADEADTASYINPANVGLIPSASYSLRSKTASFAETIVLAQSASFALRAASVTGSVDNARTASFLSYTAGLSNGTSSYTVKLKGVELITRSLSTTVGDAVVMCSCFNWTHMMHLAVNGLHCATSKTYIVGEQYTSPGLSTPYSPSSPWDGWFTVKPLVTPNEYPYQQSVYTDFDLEASQSGVHKVTFRIRTSAENVSGTSTPTASLTIWTLGLNSAAIVVEPESTVASSNTLPAWGSSFATFQGNYRFVVSGSTTSTSGFTGSLLGTASNAITASYLKDVGAASVDSASHALRADTGSYLHGTASWADHSHTSSFLDYTLGTDNGTASYAYNGRRVDTASFAHMDSPTVPKAWAEIYWGSSGGTVNSFTTSCAYNISSIEFLDSVNNGGDCPFLFGITFENNLPSTNYMLIGNAQKPFNTAEQGRNVFIPPSSSDFPKYVNGCTMSVMIDSSWYSNFWQLQTGANWYTRQTASLSFTILGT